MISFSECCIIENETIHVNIKALPGVSKTEFTGVKDGRLKVKLAAAPEGGRANDELIAFIAKALRCPRQKLAILRGEKSRLKTLALPREYAVQLEKIIKELIS
jgi:uncharacterized protein (TIGR00251 family)